MTYDVPSSSAKHVNCFTAYWRFVYSAEVCVEPATLFGWADNRWMRHQYVTDSSNKSHQVLNSEFFFLSDYSSLPYYLSLTQGGKDHFIPFPKAVVQNQMKTAPFRILTQLSEFIMIITVTLHALPYIYIYIYTYIYLILSIGDFTLPKSL